MCKGNSPPFSFLLFSFSHNAHQISHVKYLRFYTGNSLISRCSQSVPKSTSGGHLLQQEPIPQALCTPHPKVAISIFFYVPLQFELAPFYPMIFLQNPILKNADGLNMKWQI